MSYILTYKKKEFYPLEPKIEDIDIEDIAHALSLLCRANGHFKHFYSVGLHSLNCAYEAQARGYSQNVILGCLLHDASEAYMSDVPRPFKKSLPEYVQAEEELLDKIYEHFLGSKLDEEEEKIVKTVDDALLYYDLKELLNETPEWERPTLHIELDYNFVPFADVEQEYLDLFQKYSN